MLLFHSGQPLAGGSQAVLGAAEDGDWGMRRTSWTRWLEAAEGQRQGRYRYLSGRAAAVRRGTN
ncbi:hypothetical protein GCM10022245_06330 [Streptomyces mayteni]